MAFYAFKEQIQKLQSEGSTEFRRMNLVYAFQDLVNPLKSSDIIPEEIITAVGELLRINSSDLNLMNEIGFDLIETAIKLQILSGTNPHKTIKDLAISIAFQSSPKELLIELNALMTYMKIEGEEQTLDMFKNITTAQKDIFKTIITFYLSIVIKRIEEKHLKIAMQELYIFNELLEYQIENAHTVLGSDLILELFQIISQRSLLIKINALPETMKFLLKLIVLYQQLNKFEEHLKEAVKIICQLTGDFSQFLKACKDIIDFNSISDSILILAYMSCKGIVEEITLPYNLSGIRRLQILLLNSVRGCGSFPELFSFLFKHSVEHLEDKIMLHMLNNPYYNEGYKEFFFGLLDLCGGMLDNTKKQEFLSFFKEILNKIEDDSKIDAVKSIVKEYKWDMAKGMIIDWVCEWVIKSKVDLKLCFEVIVQCVEENHSLECVESLQASLKLHKLLINASTKASKIEDNLQYHKSLLETYDKIYKEFSLAFDANAKIPKLGLILQDITEMKLFVF